MSSYEPIDTAAALQTARQYLQNRDFDAALTILQQAIARDQRSPELYELLGVAYTQKGMISEGLQALTSAVTLNPSNATSRINLAVALQRAGHLPEAAVQLQEALKIDPVNEEARSALQGLQAQMGQATQSVPPYNQPAANYAPAQPQPLNQPSAAGPYGQPSPYGSPYGASTQGPPQGYGQPMPQGYPAAPGAGPYNPYGQGAYGQPPYGGGYYGTVPDDPNGWSPANIGPILSSPVEFFQRQRGQQGIGQPLGFFVILMFVGLVASLLNNSRVSANGGGIIGVPLGGLILLLLWFVNVGFFHLFVMMFRGQGGFPGTFRAMSYASVPYWLLVTVSQILVAATGVEALAGVIVLIASIWSFVLLVFAFREIHGLTSGSAFGAAFIPAFLLFVLMILFVIVVGAAIFGALMGAAGSMPHSGVGGPSGGFPSSQFPSSSFPR